MTMRPDLPPRQDARADGPREVHDIPAFLGGGNEHPLIPIPFTATIDGRQYAGEGISLVEARVLGLADPALDNRERLVRIAFDFGGFAVTLHPKARIGRDLGAGQAGPQRLVLRFTEPTGEHLPQLRHILNDYISGDLTAMGGVLRAGAVVPAAPRARVARLGFWGALRRAVGTLAVLALTFLLVAAAALLVGQRLLVTRLDQPGQVALAGETLRAVADGQVTYMDAEAARGEVAFAIATTSGETLSIAMPCDCRAAQVGVSEGSTVLAGEPVLTLLDEDGATVVEAQVPAADLFALQQAGGATMRLADGRTVFGRLVHQGTLAPGEDVAPVRLAPAQPLDASLAGQAVELTIHRDPGRALGGIRDGLANAWASARALLPARS